MPQAAPQTQSAAAPLLLLLLLLPLLLLLLALGGKVSYPPPRPRGQPAHSQLHGRCASRRRHLAPPVLADLAAHPGPNMPVTT